MIRVSMRNNTGLPGVKLLDKKDNDSPLSLITRCSLNPRNHPIVVLFFEPIWKNLGYLGSLSIT